MTDPQCMLIVDDEKNALAELPLHILRIGVDVFYATSGEEAWLLHRANFACFHGTHGCIIRVRGPVAPTACRMVRRIRKSGRQRPGGPWRLPGRSCV